MAASSSSTSSKKTSEVWQFFVKSEAEPGKVKCSLCHVLLSHSQSNTTTMIKHMKRYHDEQFQTSKQQKKGKRAAEDLNNPNDKQPKLGFFLACKAKLDPSSPKAQALTNKIARMIFMDMQPFSFVEDSGFRGVMAEAEPRFTIPSRQTFRYNVIPKLYNQAAQALQKKVENFKVKYGGNAIFSVTTDAWTSSATDSYITYTLHIVEDDLCISSYVLSTVNLTQRHTIHNLKAHLLQTLMKWKILLPLSDSQATTTGPTTSATSASTSELNLMEPDPEEETGWKIILLY